MPALLRKGNALLAAGRATRMGVPKLLLPYTADQSLLTHAVATLSRCGEGSVAVILGHQAALFREALRGAAKDGLFAANEVHCLYNAQYWQGLATSLGVAVSWAEAQQFDGLLLLAADQPFVEVHQLRQLWAVFEKRPSGIHAVAAACGGQLRNPAVVDATFFAPLSASEGDRGARPFLEAHADQVIPVEWGEGPWFEDIDAWPAYVQSVRRGGWGGKPPEVTWLSAPPLSWLRQADRCVHADPAPRLAPGTLLVAVPKAWPIAAETLYGVRLPAMAQRVQALPETRELLQQGVDTLLFSAAQTAAEKLAFVRAAACWALSLQIG
ncbi:MAG: nucleotidyltransferase family protein [Firmicutes bacterium]|nr:nucleotidyltransferase family protein [Bacillota bacterium]